MSVAFGGFAVFCVLCIGLIVWGGWWLEKQRRDNLRARHEVDARLAELAGLVRQRADLMVELQRFRAMRPPGD